MSEQLTPEERAAQVMKPYRTMGLVPPESDIARAIREAEQAARAEIRDNVKNMKSQLIRDEKHGTEWQAGHDFACDTIIGITRDIDEAEVDNG